MINQFRYALLGMGYMVMLLTLFSVNVIAADLTAFDIMRKNDNLEDGDTFTANMTMFLVDSRDQQRVRQVKNFRKDYGNDSKSIMFFLSPADVKNTSSLSFEWDNSGKDDENWLYLPALKRVKRIPSSSRKDSFMGSDFSYADINGMELTDWKYKIEKDNVVVDGHDCWLISAAPIKAKRKEVLKETGYLKRLSWVRKDNFLAIKGRIWVKKGKKIKIFRATKIQKIQGIWTISEMRMDTTKKGRREHSTVLRFNDIHYNNKLADNMFNTQRMARGL